MYIGIDVGTSSVKAALFDEKGSIIISDSQRYAISGDNAHLELNPIEVRDAVFKVLRTVSSKGLPVSSIGTSSLGEAAVLLDREGNILGNAILPGDVRGAEEADKLADPLDITKKTGLPVNSTYTACKLLWIMNNDPSRFEKIKHVMLFGDYIAWCLTGERGISKSLASRSMAYNIHEQKFFSPAEGIDADWFSKPMEADECVGVITEEIENITGIKAGTPVFAGGHDQPCAAAGVGALEAGDAVDSIGTSECITMNLGSRVFDVDFISRTNFAQEPFIKAGCFDTMAYHHTACRLVDWFTMDLLGSDDPDILIRMNGLCTDEPSGLLMLPHFSGAGTPTMDPFSTGAIVGLNLRTKPENIYQAILEGASFEMRQNLDLMAECGIDCERIIAVGGGAKSAPWLQMKADIYQVPVVKAACGDASCLGAAMAGAVGVKDFSGFDEAADAMTGITEAYYPREKQMMLYEAEYERYIKMYEAVKMINTRR